MKLAAVGCPRNCAEATVKDLGAVAIEGGWQVYVGGAPGSGCGPQTFCVRSRPMRRS